MRTFSSLSTLSLLSLSLLNGIACSTETSSSEVSAPEATSAEAPSTAEVTPNNSVPVSTPTPSNGSLPDLKKGLSREGCDNGPGVMGAASYFVGELKITDEGVEGEEEWILFANQKWAAHNGGDCTVRWSLSGTKRSRKACGRCDFGITVTNQMDMTGSTCPEDMAKGETGQQIEYDIDLKEDGTVNVYFAKSGKPVGEGYHKDGVIRYVTDMSCRWF